MEEKRKLSEEGERKAPDGYHPIFWWTVFVLPVLLFQYAVIHRDIPATISSSSTFDRSMLFFLEPLARLEYEFSRPVSWSEGMADYLSGWAAFASSTAGSIFVLPVIDSERTFDFSTAVTTDTRYIGDVQMRSIHLPDDAVKSDAAIVFIPSGDSLDAGSSSLLRSLAVSTGARFVASLEFGTFASMPFPSALQACEGAVLHLMKNGKEELNIDPKKIIVIGEGLGGTVAAALVKKLSANNDTRVHGQVLIHPILRLDGFSSSTKHLVRNRQAPLHYLNADRFAVNMLLYAGIKTPRKNIETFVNIEHSRIEDIIKEAKINGSEAQDEQPKEQPSLAGTLQESLEPLLVNPECSPLAAKDFASLPSSLVLTMEADLFRDDGRTYAERLGKAGVPTSHIHYSDGFHGALRYYRYLNIADKIAADIGRWIRDKTIVAS